MTFLYPIQYFFSILCVCARGAPLCVCVCVRACVRACVSECACVRASMFLSRVCRPVPVPVRASLSLCLSLYYFYANAKPKKNISAIFIESYNVNM